MSRDGGRVAFELERFELAGDDRLEVAGRWFGVRGLRFVRPSLTVQTEDGARNLLALLEHKPWAAEEGRSWIAAFPWQGDSPDPGEVELAVAPSVVVTLTAVPGEAQAESRRTVRKQALHERLKAEETRARRLEREVAWLREEREALRAAAEEASAERERVTGDLADARRERDAAAEERDRLVRERDVALFEAEAAAVERNDALRERGEAVERREGVLAERATVLAERDEALRGRDAAVRERDRAALERDQAVRDRDDARAERETAIADRDAALGRTSGFPSVSAQDSAPPRGPAPVRATVLPGARHADRVARAVAVSAIVALLVVVILLLKFL